jgi:hypothetical protein
MTMPGFTAEASLATNRARYNTTTARSMPDEAVLRPQMPCGAYVAQYKRHSRELAGAIARQDWDVVDVMLAAVRRDQRSIEMGC